MTEAEIVLKSHFLHLFNGQSECSVASLN